MKHLEIIFKGLQRTLFTLFILGGGSLFAQPYASQEGVNTQGMPSATMEQSPMISTQLQRMDSVEISLLTCQPHDEIYSLYGHTALRYHELWSKGYDIAFNYGVFDFRKPFFVGRFVLGWTDYELGAYPYSLFQEEYRRFGSMVTEQVLNLTAEEKLRLKAALAENMREGNRVYRYNYFYNNCTTKARDIIESCIAGRIIYEERPDVHPTYRDMIHEMTQRHPWAAFGNDMLLGIRSDVPTTMRQQEFLPNNLLYDFDHARIYANGQYRPLVKERRVAVPAGIQTIKQGFPLSPTHCAWLITLFGALLYVIQRKRHRAILAWDIMLTILQATIGTLLFVMLFSEHPTTTLNLLFILCNPLPWLFLPNIARQRQTRWWAILSVLIILFLIGGIWQTYAEGIWCLALCLLMQCHIHLFVVRSIPTDKTAGNKKQLTK